MTSYIYTLLIYSNFSNRYCQPRLIVLPFNWGDQNPDKITLDDGSRWKEGTQVSGYSKLTTALVQHM